MQVSHGAVEGDESAGFAAYYAWTDAIADIIRSAGEQDKAAVSHLESVVDGWDTTHRYYLDS